MNTAVDVPADTVTQSPSAEPTATRNTAGDVTTDTVTQSPNATNNELPPLVTPTNLIENEEETSEATGKQILGIHLSGTVKKRRKRWTIREKLSMLRKVEDLQANHGYSARAAAQHLNIDQSQIGRWKRDIAKFESSERKQIKSFAPGRESSIANIEADLLRWVFEQRERGICVSTTSVMFKARNLSRTFQLKTTVAQYKVCQRWVKRVGLVHRVGTRESQKRQEEVDSEAKEWVHGIRKKLQQPCYSLDYTLNMDQTCVRFSLHNTRSLDVKGKRTIYLRKAKGDTKRMTAAFTVTASGRQLQPCIVFKGEAEGRIVKKEFPTYVQGPLYLCQTKAWMDERCMLAWIEKILRPYVETAPENIIPIIFLDSYRCHMMGSVVRAIEALGCEVQIIPGGCTCVVQPVDVGYNKPLKVRVKRLFNTWMQDEAVGGVVIPEPTRKMVADWVLSGTKEMTRNIIWNCWRRKDFSWYDDEVSGVVEDVNDENEEEEVWSDSEEEDGVDEAEM